MWKSSPLFKKIRQLMQKPAGATGKDSTHPSSCIMHRESIHKYRKPRARVTNIASRKVLGSFSVSNPWICASRVSTVVLKWLPSPQQWLRATHCPFAPREGMRRNGRRSELSSPTSITRRGKSNWRRSRHSTWFRRHVSSQRFACCNRSSRKLLADPDCECCKRYAVSIVRCRASILVGCLIITLINYGFDEYRKAAAGYFLSNASHYSAVNMPCSKYPIFLHQLCRKVADDRSKRHRTSRNAKRIMPNFGILPRNPKKRQSQTHTSNFNHPHH